MQLGFGRRRKDLVRNVVGVESSRVDNHPGEHGALLSLSTLAIICNRLHDPPIRTAIAPLAAALRLRTINPYDSCPIHKLARLTVHDLYAGGSLASALSHKNLRRTLLQIRHQPVRADYSRLGTQQSPNYSLANVRLQIPYLVPSHHPQRNLSQPQPGQLGRFRLQAREVRRLVGRCRENELARLAIGNPGAFAARVEKGTTADA
jgi:hypothetical protein